MLPFYQIIILGYPSRTQVAKATPANTEYSIVILSEIYVSLLAIVKETKSVSNQQGRLKMVPGQYIVAKIRKYWEDSETEGWHFQSHNLSALSLHEEAGKVTYGKVVEQ